MEPVFHPLSGPETMQIILREIQQHMFNSGEFPNHITFPHLHYRFHLEVFAQAPMSFTKPNAGIDLEVGQAQPGEIVLDLSGGNIIDTPDEARHQAGMPIPTPKPGKQGITDVLVPPSAPKAKPSAVNWPTSVEGIESYPHDVTPGEPARNVSIRTNANPQGADLGGIRGKQNPEFPAAGDPDPEPAQESAG